MPGIEDKLMTASQIKEVTDTKLDKDFSSLDTSGGFSLTDELAVNISGSPYRITGRTLANAIGGGGTEQAALTNYVKNCGTISSLPATFTDSNITADMIVIEYTVGDESAVGSDWTVTTSDGSFTIAGTLAKSTSLSIVFGVGYSTTPSILTNLASDSPDNILKASPRPGVTGVLPLVNGGVGSSTAAGARTNLDVYSKSETNSAIQQSTAIKNVTNQFSISATKGTISQKKAYRSGNVVALGFVLTASEAVGGGGGFGCTATVSDASLKPICRQAGSSSLPSIGCVNVDGTSSGMNIVVTAYSTVNAGTAFWVLATYICNG